jgi:hypothetical protein
MLCDGVVIASEKHVSHGRKPPDLSVETVMESFQLLPLVEGGIGEKILKGDILGRTADRLVSGKIS